jgi:hypothetical protein
MRTRGNFIKKAWFILGLAVPALFVFRNLFVDGSLAWGDAPYFYSEGFSELIDKPYAWTARDNNFGGPNRFLFMYPLMFLFGIFSSFTNITGDLIVSIYFYLPAVVLSFISPSLFTKNLGFSRKARFFTSLLYGLNTYFLLLIDGGQVGTLLAYSVFPLSLLCVKKYFDKPRINNYVLATMSLSLVAVGDPRIALISILVQVLWVTFEGLLAKNAFKLVKIITGFLLISSFWLIPLLLIPGDQLSTDISKLNLYSLLNSFFLFQPHWSGNIFGQVTPPSPLFALMPLLIFAGFLFKQKKKYLIFASLFVFFAFLSKGATPPFGFIYDFTVNNIPFGFVFRDSSKFFIPLVLFAGMLIGMTVEKFKKKWFAILVYLYLLFTMSPALLGKLNFVLSKRVYSQDFSRVYQKLKKETLFARTLWFPERHPLAFQTHSLPALDARGLADERPFASMTVGSYDRFNFLHNNQFLEWSNILGIKYLVLSGDYRKVKPNDDDIKDWEALEKVVSGNRSLIKEDVGEDISFYSLPEVKPNIFSVDRLIVVVGGDEVYEGFKGAIGNNAFVFAEDGIFNSEILLDEVIKSVVFVFSNKDKTDLSASFLKDVFIDPKENARSDWGYYSNDNYLLWKYQLLIRDIETKEHNYSKGVALSTKVGETIEFELPINTDGEYVVMIRSLSKDLDDILKIELGGGEDIVTNFRPGSFKWHFMSYKLKKGMHRLKITNQKGLHAIGTVGMVSSTRWKEVSALSENVLDRFDRYDLEEVDALEDNSNWKRVEVKKINPTKFQLSSTNHGGWIIFTDSYHPLWEIVKGKNNLKPVPVYSVVNGFYLPESEGDYQLVFKGQKYLVIGGIVTILTILLFLTVYFKASLRKDDKSST